MYTWKYTLEFKDTFSNESFIVWVYESLIDAKIRANEMWWTMAIATVWSDDWQMVYRVWTF